MKKILSFSILLAMLLPACSHKTKSGVARKIDDKVTVYFPSEPKQLPSGSLMAKTKTQAYVFTAVDFMKTYGIDSVKLVTIKTNPIFVSHMRAGLTRSMPDVALDSLKTGKWRGFTSYSMFGFDKKKRRYDLFMFIAGDKLYSLSTVIGNGESFSGRDNFFNSVDVSE